MDCRLDWMKTQLPKLKQKILTYIFLITVQVVAVIMLRTLGFQQSGNILMEIACYALAFSPLLVVAVLLFRKGWQFQLSTLMIAVAMAAIFLYASLVPILKIRDEHNVRLRLVSLGAEVDRGIDWTEYYEDLGLQSTHSVISSSAWAQGSFVGRQIELDDLQDIASLPNLETLMILGYGVSDSETKALVSGTNLKRLILRDSFISVSASEIERLEQIGISMW